MGDILVNCPPETLKFLLAEGLDIPKIILVPPDVPVGQQLGSSGFVHLGVNYASIEFLLYANYFFNGGHQTFLITVTEYQKKRLLQILQETIAGPEEPEEYYPYPWVQRECEAMAYYPPLNEPHGRTISLKFVVSKLIMVSWVGRLLFYWMAMNSYF